MRPYIKPCGWFKTMTTNDYLRHVHESGWQPLDGKLWQRNCYEHLVRNDGELNKIQNTSRRIDCDRQPTPKDPDLVGGRHRGDS